jgi:hypothetical protein
VAVAGEIESEAQDLLPTFEIRFRDLKLALSLLFRRDDLIMFTLEQV